MRTLARRISLGLAGSGLALAALAAPVAGATPDVYRFSGSWTVQHDCGIVEETTLTARERDFFDNGTWVRSIITFDFVGVYTSESGASFTNETHQSGTFTPTSGALSGQGTFLRAGGKPILMDVGHLVITLPDGTTIRSSEQAVTFDDPDAGARLETALCARLA